MYKRCCRRQMFGLNIRKLYLICLALEYYVCSSALGQEEALRPHLHPASITLLMLGSRESFSSEVGQLSMKSTLNYARSHRYKVLKQVSLLLLLRPQNFPALDHYGFYVLKKGHESKLY
jgi:hypothetical protein